MLSQILGRRGKVQRVFDTGDLRVSVGSRGTWTLNPESCSVVTTTPNEVNLVSSTSSSSDDDDDDDDDNDDDDNEEESREGIRKELIFNWIVF